MGYGRLQVASMKYGESEHIILHDSVRIDLDMVEPAADDEMPFHQAPELTDLPFTTSNMKKISDALVLIIPRYVDLENLNGSVEDLRGENLSGRNLSITDCP